MNQGIVGGIGFVAFQYLLSVEFFPAVGGGDEKIGIVGKEIGVIDIADIGG